jgi:hypothetical protein
LHASSTQREVETKKFKDLFSANEERGECWNYDKGEHGNTEEHPRPTGDVEACFSSGFFEKDAVKLETVHWEEVQAIYFALKCKTIADTYMRRVYKFANRTREGKEVRTRAQGCAKRVPVSGRSGRSGQAKRALRRCPPAAEAGSRWGCREVHVVRSESAVRLIQYGSGLLRSGVVGGRPPARKTLRTQPPERAPGKHSRPRARPMWRTTLRTRPSELARLMWRKTFRTRPPDCAAHTSSLTQFGFSRRYTAPILRMLASLRKFANGEPMFPNEIRSEDDDVTFSMKDLEKNFRKKRAACVIQGTKLIDVLFAMLAAPRHAGLLKEHVSKEVHLAEVHGIVGMTIHEVTSTKLSQVYCALKAFRQGSKAGFGFLAELVKQMDWGMGASAILDSIVTNNKVLVGELLDKRLIVFLILR